MNFRQVLFIGAISIFAGAIAGLITKAWVTWIGVTVISYAILFASSPWISRKFSRNPTKVKAEATEVAQDLSDRRTAQGYSPLIQGRTLETGDNDVVKEFSNEFSISTAKARNLIDSGYRSWGDLYEAIPEDLMMVPGVNPTIARRIVEVVRRKRQQYEDN